jgi:hypothetical protein
MHGVVAPDVAMDRDDLALDDCVERRGGVVSGKTRTAAAAV